MTSQRLIGAFYTPDALANVLTAWALNGSQGRVLDPSYGGCAFLRASLAALTKNGATNASRQVFGVDIDPNCVNHAAGLVPSTQYVTADFLQLRPNTLRGTPFRAIVGNPPYVRHHWFNAVTRRRTESISRRSKVPLPKTASTWAYFLVHALSFLADDGRLALLVPEAVLQADYAESVRSALRKRFAVTHFIHIRSRVFAGTQESVVVVAGEGQGPGNLRFESVNDVGQLDCALRRQRSDATASSPASTRHIVPRAVELLSEIESADHIKRLGELARVRIGLVTGCNQFFVRNVEDVCRLGLPMRVTSPILSRARLLTGLRHTERDQSALLEQGHRALLVRPTAAMHDHPAVKTWVSEGTELGVQYHYKCTLRNPWYEVTRGPAPDAFATCARLGSPLLILNEAKIHCTNALHAVHWLKPAQADPRATAVGFLTSFVGLWSEVHGRRYGGGVLKIEPGLSVRIPVPMVANAGSLFERLDELVRAGREDEARRAADQTVLRDGLGLSEKDVNLLQEARSSLIVQRVPSGAGGPVAAV